MIFFLKSKALDGLFLVLYPMPRILVPGGTLDTTVRKTTMVTIKINLLYSHDLYSDILNSTCVSMPIQRRQPQVLSGIQVALIKGKH